MVGGTHAQEDDIVDLVGWLKNGGYDTREWSDGSVPAVQEGAVPFPMVSINTTPGRMVWEVDKLYKDLASRGAPFERDNVSLECTYSPETKIANIVLIGVLSHHVHLGELVEHFD